MRIDREAPGAYDRLEKFFDTAKERHMIYIKKTLGLPRPWTNDSQFNTWYFCNVFRRLDKVSDWIVENVVKPYADDKDLWKKLLLARRLSRIETMEALKTRGFFENLEGAKGYLHYLRAVGVPIMTNAFVMGIPDPSLGDNKVDYIFNLIDFYEKRGIAEFLEKTNSVEETVTFLKQAPNMAGFLSYELASDFVYSRYLENANDLEKWANPGPGCKRGLNVIYYNDADYGPMADKEAVDRMRFILSMWKIHVATYLFSWVQELRDVIPFDKRQTAVRLMMMFDRVKMREVEHWLCEFDKHERTRRNKRRYP